MSATANKRIPLTVFKPTYNRAHTLPRTYESLCRQSCKDFLWLIIDDGSNDRTFDFVSDFQKQSSELFPIYYIKKENGGKHTAINRSHSYIHGKYCFVLDSDDIIIPTAVEIFLETPKNGQMPKNCDKMILLTKIALIKIIK